MADTGNGHAVKRSGSPSEAASTKRQRENSEDSESTEYECDEFDPKMLTPPSVEGLLDVGVSPVKLPEELLQTFYKDPGVLLISGMVSWDLVGKRVNNPQKYSHPNLYTFHKFTDRKYRLIASSCSAAHSILVSDEGKTFVFGRNTCGQLGLNHTETVNEPTEVPALKNMNIIHVAVGRNHSLFLEDTGNVYACGDNKSGQCGVGTNSVTVQQPTRIRYSGPRIVKVGCGAEFSMILDCNGDLHSFGLPEYGQLGHNSDEKLFITANKLSFNFVLKPKKINRYVEKTKEGHTTTAENVEIVDFSCGNNHTVAIDSNKRIFSWGFGGFGRLGHAVPRDEAMPRLIKFFETQGRGVRSIICGATYTLAVNDLGALYLFGQTKRTGEANMYPKPVNDLAGWNIRAVGASATSILVAADNTLVAWGTSPTYGELGTGDLTKSSAKPMEVSRMSGLSITQVAMGLSHSLILCNDSTEGVKEKLASIPVFEP